MVARCVYGPRCTCINGTGCYPCMKPIDTISVTTAAGDRPPTHNVDYPLFYVVLILLMAAALLAWQAHSRVASFRESQEQVAVASVTGAANEIETLLFELRRSVGVFAAEQAQLLGYLAEHPGDESRFADLNAKIRSYFPEVFAFTVADDAGVVLLEELPNLVGEACQRDIRRFATEGHRQGVRIHPQPDGYHFDIMAPLPGQGGVFFISFKPNMLVRVLANSQAPGHWLLLVLQGDPARVVEASAEGVRGAFKREHFLQPWELEALKFATPVEGSLWNLLDIASPELLTEQRMQSWTQAGALLMVFIAASLSMLYLTRHEERRRSRAERSLRESHATLKAVIEGIADGVYMKDLDGRYRLVNSKFAQLVGAPVSEVVGRGDVDLFSEAVAIRFAHADEETIGSARVSTREETDEAREQTALVTRAPYYDAENRVAGVIGIRHDITELKQVQEQVRRHERELAHVDRLSLMGELASSLAHELNQPLGAVVNYAQACLGMVRSGGGDTDKVITALQETVDQARRAGDIIHRIRDFVQKDTRWFRCLALLAVVNDVRDFIRAELRGKHVSLVIQIKGPLPKVLADRIQIEQVLLNLIFNAMEAMQAADTAHRQIIIVLRALGSDKVQVTVSDNGPGIDAADAEGLFRPFFSTKSHGMGMGLAISRSIIEAHSGRLWAGPGAERGAVFHFTLPASPECVQ
jgi:PAS domain S-box-containing protein